MKEPLFSEQEKNSLAGFKVTYRHNLAEASRVAMCSLQAAEALSQILYIFVGAIEKIHTNKDMADFLRRLQDNARIEILLGSKDFADMKTELTKKLNQLIEANKKNVTRLRKSVKQ